MKKSILLLSIISVFLLLSFTAVKAETIFWEETFDYDNGDWTLENNWAISSGKLQLYWSPTITNYDLEAVSPVLNLPENVGNLIVKQHINVYSIVDEVAEICIIHNENYIILWSYEMINGNWGSESGTDISFSLMDYAGEDIQIKFRSFGTPKHNEPLG